MLEKEIYEKENKYLRYINILIILNIFMVIVVVIIYLNNKPDFTGKTGKVGRMAVGHMPPDMRIRPVKDVEDASKRINEYIDMIGLTKLALKRVVVFKKYYYVYVKEEGTGRTAFALKLIKFGTFSLKKFPSMYPQMMWNEKYGHRAKEDLNHIGKMKNTLEDAIKLAEDVTSKLGASYTLTKNPDVYYGFYEFIVFQNKVAVGEISINGDSGKVFFKMFSSPPISLSEFI